MAEHTLLNGASGYIVSRLRRVVEEGGCLGPRVTRRSERLLPAASSPALMLETTLQAAVAQTQAPVRFRSSIGIAIERLVPRRQTKVSPQN
jgi:hypothetical protein